MRTAAAALIMAALVASSPARDLPPNGPFPILPAIPARYDHPYPHPIVLVEVPREQMSDVGRVCKGASEWECAEPHPDGCNAYVLAIGPGGLTVRTFSLLYLHARAHCNGWPAAHGP